MNAFGAWLDEQRSRVSPRSRLGEKLTYTANTNQWDGLLVFLYDGHVEMDSNFVEHRIHLVGHLDPSTACLGTEPLACVKTNHRILIGARRTATTALRGCGGTPSSYRRRDRVHPHQGPEGDLVAISEMDGLLGRVVCVRRQPLPDEANAYARRNRIKVVQKDEIFEGFRRLLHTEGPASPDQLTAPGRPYAQK